MTKVMMSASVTRHYGNISATFGASYEAEIKTGGDASKAYEACLVTIATGFDDFESSNPLLRHGPAQDKKGAGDAKERIEATSIFWTQYKGKKILRIGTDDPRFKKFGLAVYEDNVLEIATRLIGDADRIDLKGAGVIIVVQNKRVIGLENYE